jgi:soluble lytic murein transglycosylase-like protein
MAPRENRNPALLSTSIKSSPIHIWLATVMGVLAAQSPAFARPPLNELYNGTKIYLRIAEAEAFRNRVPFELVDAVMAVESAYDPLARGDVGEIGLMQLLPSTAALMGFSGPIEVLAKPEIDIALGAQYLAEAWRLADGDICTTVMKYRAGHGETRFSERSVNYCLAVRARLRRAGFPVTGSVPKPTLGFGNVTRLTNGRIRVRFPGTAKCFARAVQPGSRFGACIPRSALKIKKLLR